MGYLTAAQIEAAMTALAAPADGLCTKTALPNPTVSEGMGPTTYSYLKIGNGSGPGRVTVLAIAGMHARELAQPDAVISFAQKLLAAYRGPEGTKFEIPAYTDGSDTYGPVRVDQKKIKAMLDRMDILLVPLANPDGRAFNQTSDVKWRKNRAPRPAGGSDATVGVDLNRNFDIGWDFDTFYSENFVNSGDLHSSRDKASVEYIGKPLPAPQGAVKHPDIEPEVRNLIWILDHHPVTYSVDLHAPYNRIMHPWGIEKNGKNPTQTFRNRFHDRGGGGAERDGNLPGNDYSEYFPYEPPSSLLRRHCMIVKSIRAGIFETTGRLYDYGGIAEKIYPATGSFTDFHFSRQFTIPGSPQIHAFTAEMGPVRIIGDAKQDDFQPIYTDPNGFPRIEREVHAVLLRLLEAALPPAPPPALPPPAPPPPAVDGGKKKCFFSMAAADLVAGAAWLETLRRGRAALLAGARTRGAMLALDRLYRRVGNSLVPLIAGRRSARRAIAYGVVAPAAGLTALALKWRAR